MKGKTFKPGEKVPCSGIYKNTKGGKATCVKNEPFPPGPKGGKWKLVIPTKPKCSK